MSFPTISLAKVCLWTVLLCTWFSGASTSGFNLTGISLPRALDQAISNAYLLIGPFGAAQTSLLGTGFNLQTEATSYYGTPTYYQRYFTRVQSQASSGGAIPTTWEAEVFSALNSAGDTVDVAVCCTMLCLPVCAL